MTAEGKVNSMGIYIRPFRFLKIRISKRGARVGVGPRWLRF